MGRESEKLLDLIKKAISDGVVTSKEYDQILSQAGADGREDPEEMQLLRNLQEMIANKTVKRVG